MSIDIKRPVFVCGENPGMTLYKPDTDQPVAIVSYWTCDLQSAWHRKCVGHVAG